MSDSNRNRGISTLMYHADIDEKYDLMALCIVTGESASQILRKALKEYFRQRVRAMKPETDEACRLILRYRNQRGTK